MATLINGNLNNPVYASQDADLLAAICGNKTVVTPVGSQFAEEQEDANTIKVDDGVIITKEGRRIQLDNGDIDEFLIPTGTQGQTHYYICGYHLYTDEESAELCETFVEAVSSGTDVIDEDTFRDGSTEVYVSLLRVKQEGVNITAITRLLPSGTDMNQINVGLSGKVNATTFNQLPVSPNSSAFKNDNGLNVVNLGNNGYRDVQARNYYLRGGDHICCENNISFTNTAMNEYRSLAISDILFSGSASAWGLIQKALSHVRSYTSVSFTNCTMDSQQLPSITKSGSLTHIHAVFTPNVQISAGTALYVIPTDYLTRWNGQYQTWGAGVFALDGTNTFKRISLSMTNGALYSDAILYAGVKYELDISLYNAISY